MTEPVAYLVNGVAFNDIDRAKFYSDVLKYHKKIDIESLVPIPLYTAEQLHPRVKMTKEQKQLMMSYKNNKEPFFILLSRTRQLINNPFESLSEEEIMSAWLNPEETIEIVPDMKWFVRSKQLEEDEGEYYLFLSGSDIDDLDYLVFDYAKAFDTKEEAEKWTNPLTEAVQLQVEEK